MTTILGSSSENPIEPIQSSTTFFTDPQTINPNITFTFNAEEQVDVPSGIIDGLLPIETSSYFQLPDDIQDDTQDESQEDIQDKHPDESQDDQYQMNQPPYESSDNPQDVKHPENTQDNPSESVTTRGTPKNSTQTEQAPKETPNVIENETSDTGHLTALNRIIEPPPISNSSNPVSNPDKKTNKSRERFTQKRPKSELLAEIVPTEEKFVSDTSPSTPEYSKFTEIKNEGKLLDSGNGSTPMIAGIAGSVIGVTLLLFLMFYVKLKSNKKYSSSKYINEKPLNRDVKKVMLEDSVYSFKEIIHSPVGEPLSEAEANYYRKARKAERDIHSEITRRENSFNEIDFRGISDELTLTRSSFGSIRDSDTILPSHSISMIAKKKQNNI